MKWLLLLILLPGSSIAQDTPIVKVYTLDECSGFDQPNIFNGKSIFTVQPMEPIIVLELVKQSGSTDTEWWHVITARGEGYISKNCIRVDERSLYKWEKIGTLQDRIEYARRYYKQTHVEFNNEALSLASKRLDAANKRLNHIKDSMSKFVAILDSYCTENAIELTDFSFQVFNCNKTKRIKYIWVTATAFNPVNDPVTTKTFQGIGPIEPFTESAYSFKSGFVSKVVSYCILKSVKIQYMDGSIVILSKDKIKTGKLSADTEY